MNERMNDILCSLFLEWSEQVIILLLFMIVIWTVFCYFYTDVLKQNVIVKKDYDGNVQQWSTSAPSLAGHAHSLHFSRLKDLPPVRQNQWRVNQTDSCPSGAQLS